MNNLEARNAQSRGKKSEFHRSALISSFSCQYRQLLEIIILTWKSVQF